MHDQVGVGDARVDFFDAADGQDIPGGLAGEFVSAMAGADGDGQGVKLRGFDKSGGLFGVGEHLAVVEFAHGADAVFFAGFAGFQVAQAAQLAFDGGANGMRHLDHGAGDVDVVVKARRRFAIFHERAIHHDRTKAQVERAMAHLGAGAVVLVHDQRNMRPLLSGGLDQVFDERLTGVLACTRAGLQNDRRTDLVGGLHNGLDLFEVVDVESGDAVAVDRSVVEQFAHGNECHGFTFGKVGNRLVTR